MRIFIKGKAVPFATKLEKDWKETLRNQIPSQKEGITYRGLKLIFHLESLHHNKQPFDLDNLVEPVLSVLVNEKGYFGGKRANIIWWYARKTINAFEGVEIELSKNSPPSIKGKLLIDDIYSGEMPRSAKSKEIPEWLASKGIKPATQGDKFSLHLSFPERINIGDIATGVVKSTIDCLYPLIGGTAGSPEDWRIDEMLVEKGNFSDILIKIFAGGEKKMKKLLISRNPF